MVLILGSTLASPGKKKKQLLTIETNIQPQALPQGFWCTWSVMLLKLMRMSFFKEISYYLAPVTLLPYCSQNILHLWGFSTCCQPFSWHSLLLFLRFQLLSVTSEILFMNMLFILVSHSYPCFSVTKAYCLPSEYLPDLVWSPVPLECKQQEDMILFCARIPKSCRCWHIIDSICQQKDLCGRFLFFAQL